MDQNAPNTFDELKARYLPPEAASRVLGGIAVQTLARWRCEGTGPKFCKVGRRVVYSVEDLAAWVASRKFSSTSESAAKVASSQ
jgi:hypothetical protein